MRNRLFLIIAALAALIFGAPAFAAPSLTPAQENALSAEIAKRAARAPEAERVAFTAADLVGSLMFGGEENDINSDGKSILCRGVIIELTAPERGALRWRACTLLGAKPGWTGPVWATSGTLTTAATAGPSRPPPASPPPVIEAEKSPAPRDYEDGAPRAAPSAPGGNTSTQTPSAAGGGLDRVISPVLVELGPAEPRYARNGGSGVVLLSENPADQALNLTLCRALFKTFDTANIGDVKAGEREKDDKLELLRPLYWPLKDLTRPALGDDKCAHRVAHYDFTRAWKIRSKLGLNGRGPYLLVIRADESRAGLVDFAGVADKDTPNLVRYFREGFAQEDDIWSPARHENAVERAALTKYLGASFQLGSLPRLVIVSVARAGCPLANTMDVCTNPMPR